MPRITADFEYKSLERDDQYFYYENGQLESIIEPGLLPGESSKLGLTQMNGGCNAPGIDWLRSNNVYVPRRQRDNHPFRVRGISVNDSTSDGVVVCYDTPLAIGLHMRMVFGLIYPIHVIAIRAKVDDKHRGEVKATAESVLLHE